MRKGVSLKLWSLFGVFVVLGIFILLSYLVQANIGFFEDLIVNNVWGIGFWIFLNFMGIVLAPLAVIPLIAVVTAMWGPVVAGLSTWVAWVLGALVAFAISRELGVPVVKRFISMDELYSFEERFSIVGSFWGIVLLRMVIPVEVLSYGLGLFSRVGYWKYLSATALGLLPIAFLFGYFGTFSINYQVILGLVILIGILVFIILGEIRGK